MFSDADVIHTYTRANAIEDGELVDVSTLAREAGFTVPVAMTRTAWLDCVEWTDADRARKAAGQDEQGRLWDVLYMARQAARRARGEPRLRYELYRVRREGRGLRARRVALDLHIGPGDAGEPVITILLPGED